MTRAPGPILRRGVAALLTAALVASVAAAPAAAAPPGFEVLVPPGAAGYRYQQVTQGAGAGFEAPAFDDAAFADGEAMFGTPNGCARDDDLATPWAPQTDLLVRRTITIPDDGRHLRLGVDVVGAAQVWLNGVELTDGLRTGGIDCPSRGGMLLDVPESALRRGEANVLAVRARALPRAAYLDLQAILVATPPNDAIADATDVAALPLADEVSLLAATLEDDEPRDLCRAGDPCGSVWYRLTPDTDLTVAIEASEDPEFGNLGIAVYRGTPWPGLELVASRAPDWRPLVVRLTAGTAYHIVIAGARTLEAGGEASVTIEAAPDPTVSIETHPDSPVSTADRVTFWPNVGDPAHQPVAGYAWDFGDGGTSEDEVPSRHFTTPGTFDVRVTVTMADGRTATGTTRLEVTRFEGPDPTASFTVAPEAPDTATDVVFSSTATDPALVGLARWRWDLGDGTLLDGEQVTHRYASEGTYVVTLTVGTWDGRSATASAEVVVTKAVLPDPSAGFAVFPDPPFVGQVASFLDLSWDPAGIGISAIRWDFGDGTTDGGPFVSHAFTAVGPATVTLTVETSDGRTATATRTIDVQPAPPPAAYIATSLSDPSTLDTVRFTGVAWDPAGGPIASYAWDLGDGTTAEGAEVSHRYRADGTYTATLTVATPDGRTATASLELRVATHDVALVRLTAAKSGGVGQVRPVAVELANRQGTPETVVVQLLRSTSQGYELVGERRLTLRGGRSERLSFDYTFTAADATLGRITFKAVAILEGARDARPADNEAISGPVRVTG